ncbi:alpha/beta fold hydrolase [Nocardia sp. alder85J]|uniref:alpha/beta fold hydrolase n=1 Tax=Nocardia sp. alder85J TaxID=2862949 RepID=UPI001CD515F7|nr:alpha/beta hydrolase [Nocardia sp. alder85J]MCX4095019.1 alpha/beta hydrolase [Nocardia sp. alder85J]
MAHILLIPGFWLGAWAWDAVAGRLRDHGHEVTALTLPGLDPDAPHRLDTTVAEQAAAIVAAAPVPTVLVSHSGGAAPAYLASDIAPQNFSHAIYVDSGPLPPGFVLDPDLSPDTRELPLPDWPELEAAGNSLAGLDELTLQRFRSRAVSQPATIARTPLPLSDSPAGRTIPTTLICCSFPAEQIHALTGTAPIFSELPHLDATFIDLHTGHWPMWSRPTELAELIHTAAKQ